MATEVRMPQLGESVTEGTVLRWLKQPGEHVALDESLAEIETEKVNVEIPSPFEGTLATLLVPEGETVAVGVPIATIEEADGRAAAPAAPPAAIEARGRPPVTAAAAAAPPRSSPQSQPAATGQRRLAASFAATGPLGPASTAHGMFSTGEREADGANAVPAPPMADQPPPAAQPATQPGAATSNNGSNGATRFSPAVLRLAREHSVDLNQVQGSGLGGRITRKDVQAWIDRGGAPTAAQQQSNLGEERQLFESGIAPTEPAASPVVEEVQEAFAEPTTGAPVPVEQRGPVPGPAAPATPAPTAIPTAATRTVGEDEVLEPLTATRKAIAAHMVRSVQTAPHAWMMIEVDLSRLVAYREHIKEEFRRREAADLSYLPFMIKAVVAALKQHPRMNSSWSDEGVMLKRRINIGIAVDTEQGLVVPVIHDADNYSVAGLARQVTELAARARSRRLKLEHVQGGTFTVDNVGPIGSVISMPIINQPQAAIVTMESIVKRPVVVNDTIAIRSIMNCCLSFDHRIVDGGDVGPFMKTLKRNLEAMGEETPLY